MSSLGKRSRDVPHSSDERESILGEPIYYDQQESYNEKESCIGNKPSKILTDHAEKTEVTTLVAAKADVKGLIFDCSATIFYADQVEKTYTFLDNPVAAELPQFPHDPELTRSIEEYKNLVSKNPDSYNLHIHRLCICILFKAHEIYKETLNTRALLHKLANLSQAELHKSTIELEGGESQMKRRKTMIQMFKEEREQVHNRIVEITEYDPYHDLITAAQTFDGLSYFSRETINNVDLCDGVKAVARAIGNLFTCSEGSLRSPGSTGWNSEFEGLAVTRAQYKSQIERVISNLNEQLGGKGGKERSVNEDQSLMHHLAKTILNKIGLWKGLYVPGPRSQETEGVQPILHWILCQIAKSLNKPNQRNCGQVNSFCKTNVARERPLIAKTKTDYFVRYPDITVSKNEDANIQISASDSYPITIELKPHERASEEHKDVHGGGVQQCLSRVAKILGLFFNFGGVGTDGHATSVVGTMAYIQVVQVKLVGTGTSEANKVQIFLSEKFPLLSKTNFQKWAKSNDPKKKKKWNFAGAKRQEEDTQSENEIKELEQQLYPDDQTYDDVLGDLPSGWKLLQSVMTAKPSELNHAAWMTQCESNESDLELVGIGAFSIVIKEPKRSDGSADHVIKMSKVGRTDSLRHEAAALRILHGDENENEKYPVENAKKGDWRKCLVSKLESYGYSNLPIDQGSHFKVPSLMISPQGKSFTYYWKRFEDEKSSAKLVSFLMMIFLDYADALHFMHERGLVHLDVSTANMLVREEGRGGLLRGLLIDLSVSRKRRETISGFVGNVLFAHSDAHKNVEWYAEDFHDFAALGFALAALCAEIIGNGRPIWGAAVGSCKDKEGATERRDSAKSFIDEYFGTKHDVLLCDEAETRLRSYCASKGMKGIKESDNLVQLFQKLAKGWIKQDEISVFGENGKLKKLSSTIDDVEPLRKTTEYASVIFDATNSDRGHSHHDVRTRTTSSMDTY